MLQLFWLPCFYIYISIFFFLMIEDYETCSSLLIPIGLEMNNNKKIIIFALSPCCCWLSAATFHGTYIQSKSRIKGPSYFLLVYIYESSLHPRHCSTPKWLEALMLQSCQSFLSRTTGRVMLRTDGSPKILFSISVSAVQLKVSPKSRKNRHGKSSFKVECPSYCSQLCWECCRTLLVFKNQRRRTPS